MDHLSTRQIVLLITILLILGGLTAWGTTYVLRSFVMNDLNDPLTRQGGLSPAQSLGRK